MAKQAGRMLLNAGWAAMIVLLPVTSMPLVVRLVGSDAVAAPSGLILLALLVGWLIPSWLRGGRLPLTAVPLVAFVGVALGVTLRAAFLDLPTFKGISSLRNSIQALLTLGVGVSFYLAGSAWGQRRDRLGWALRWLNWSGAVVILYCLLQAGMWQFNHRYPQWMKDFHDLYSIGPLYRQRVSGFTLEPSWLANQLNLLFLPIWIGAVVTRHSAHRLRWGKWIAEDGLLLGGLAALGLSFSRVGLLAFFLLVGYGMLLWNVRLARNIQERWQRRQATDGQTRWVQGAVLGGMALVYAGALLGLGWVLSRLDPRMAQLFQFELGSENPFLRYANQLMFAARMVYWQAGWGVFAAHPWLGVGLGNAGFFLPDTLQGYAHGLFEVRDLLYRSGSLLNIKSIWVRLLAETGIVGFSVFLSWLVSLWFTTLGLVRQPDRQLRMIGWVGQLVILAYLVEGFSVDTFAFPYPWLTLGWVSGAALIAAKEEKETAGSSRT